MMDIIMPWLIVLLLLSIFSTVIYFRYVKKWLLRKNGMPATAKIIHMEKTLVEYYEGSGSSTWNGNNPNTIESLMRITLEIDNFTATPRQLTIKQAFLAADMPEVGSVVNILIDRKNQDNIMIVS